MVRLLYLETLGDGFGAAVAASCAELRKHLDHFLEHAVGLGPWQETIAGSADAQMSAVFRQDAENQAMEGAMAVNERVSTSRGASLGAEFEFVILMTGVGTLGARGRGGACARAGPGRRGVRR